MSQKIAIRFCPPVPAWGSQRTFAEEFIPRLLPKLSGSVIYSSIKFEGLGAENVPAQNPLLAPGLRRLWALALHQFTFARTLRARGIGVLFCPFNNEGLAWPRGLRQILIVHDLVPLLFQRDYKLSALLWRILYGPAARRSRHIICVSQATRSDVIRLLHVPPERISVVYLGYTLPQQTRPRDPRGQLLYVASAHSAHKNIAALLEAFAASSLRNTHHLRIVGDTHHQTTPHLKARAARLDLAGRVHFLSRISAEALEAEYAAADIVVYPSLCEGFGLPLLDAMARSVPICAARGSAVSEIGGEAALYFDPRDTTAMRCAMERLCRDAALQEELIARGLARVRKFSWDKCAAQYATIILDAAKAG